MKYEYVVMEIRQMEIGPYLIFQHEDELKAEVYLVTQRPTHDRPLLTFNPLILDAGFLSTAPEGETDNVAEIARLALTNSPDLAKFKDEPFGFIYYCRVEDWKVVDAKEAVEEAPPDEGGVFVWIATVAEPLPSRGGQAR